MKIPKVIKLYGQEIDINLTSTPEVIPNVGRVLGRYDPAQQKITLYHNEDKPTVAESNFIHEVIEVADTLGDLQLNHTQISALASSIHQVLTDMYAEAA